jgi:hypothetical protein
MPGYLEMPEKPRVRTDCCVKFCIGLDRLNKPTKIGIAPDKINLSKEVGRAFA